MVSEETCRDLRHCREARKLWDTPNAIELVDYEEVLEFCDAVQAFQIGILASHSQIHFANIIALQIRVYEDESSIIAVGAAFRNLRIRDLCLLCGDSPDFMEKAVRTWAASLQHLSKLRIKFDCCVGEKVCIRLLVRLHV